MAPSGPRSSVDRSDHHEHWLEERAGRRQQHDQRPQQRIDADLGQQPREQRGIGAGGVW